jgi:enediyne biosynthesis protein E4
MNLVHRPRASAAAWKLLGIAILLFGPWAGCKKQTPSDDSSAASAQRTIASSGTYDEANALKGAKANNLEGTQDSSAMNASLQPDGAIADTTNGSVPPHGVVLTDVTKQSQVDFVHWYNGGGELLIVEPVASGMATLDYDLDGWIDLYFLNGAAIPFDSARTVANGLYHNRHEMQFHLVTQSARADDRRHSLGVGVADFDADGFPDLYVNNFGGNSLLRNNGDGTFSDWTEFAQVGGGERLGAGVCFFDADGDGLVDLYVGNYVLSPIETNVKRTTDGFPSYPGPLDFQPDVDFFFHNNGDGTFSDLSEASGIGVVASTSMGVIAGDFDDDGDTDLIVVNDVDRNFFYVNDGAGKFEEIGIQAGVAFSYDAQRNGNMGIDAADFNADGYLDLYTTTFSNDLPVLYRNDGLASFEDVTQATNAGDGMLPHANWGTSFLDLENDGDKDLIIANGHTSPNVNRWAFNTAWKVANTLLMNDGRSRFVNISRTSGSGLAPIESSRGLVVDDFDNDGDVDVVILNALAGATVIRNDSSVNRNADSGNTPRSFNNWLQIDFVGRHAPRDAIGTRVSFELDGRKFIDQVHGGRGYQSSYGQRLYFGLGPAQTIPELTIRWPDGSQQVLSEVRANQRLTIVQPSS